MSLRNIVLLVKDPKATMSLFTTSFGFRVRNQSATMIELVNKSNDHGPPIIIKEAANVSSLCTGYSPLLTLAVSDMDTCIASAVGTHGAMLDGPVQYPVHGKLACLRTADGHMIGLFEPADV